MHDTVSVVILFRVVVSESVRSDTPTIAVEQWHGGLIPLFGSSVVV